MVLVFVREEEFGQIMSTFANGQAVMISEVTPRGKEFLFFSLFSMVGKTSAFIG
jgi:MFS-type transporter involved in bile tolerance (Atg22 family)